MNDIDAASLIDGEPSRLPPSNNRPTLESEVARNGTTSIYFVEEKNEARYGATSKLLQYRKLLARFAHDGSQLELFPLMTWKNQPPYFEPKYESIKSIELRGFGFQPPESGDEAADIFLGLPAGFVKDYAFGLGLKKEYKPLIDTVEKLPGVDTLVIDKDSDELVRDGSRFILPFDVFDATRRALDRIATKYRSEALQDKRDLAHNTLLHKLAPQEFPELPPRYRRDTVFQVVAASASAETGLSEKDKEAAIELVAANKGALAKEHPERLMQLRDELELVSLKELIDKFSSMLGQKLTEGKWQKFFSDNPFVLSLVFGYPVIKLGDQVAVGGIRLIGGGMKFADFVARHAQTGNIAIVEIKTPATELLGPREYRGGIYPNSAEVSGAMNQLLDQRYQLQRNLSILKDAPGLRDLQAYAIDCVLIVGTLPKPTDEARMKSFELARRALSGILLVTFDELFAKLETVYAFLNDGSASPNIEANLSSSAVDVSEPPNTGDGS
ncbi:MAG: DUF4263 domain-containing protein [Propionivibrio sp.]|nr:DUF4263 domain-containing protein [Propionivibrio sp.]